MEQKYRSKVRMSFRGVVGGIIIQINNSELDYLNYDFLIDHCADNVQNQDEEGVDCGGACATAC